MKLVIREGGPNGNSACDIILHLRINSLPVKTFFMGFFMVFMKLVHEGGGSYVNIFFI